MIFPSAEDLIEHLKKVIPSTRFLKMWGVNYEVPLFLCPYPSTQKVDLEILFPTLTKFLENKNIHVLTINLYDLSIEILQNKGLFEQLCENEQIFDKDQFLELLQGVLDVEEVIVPAVEQKLNGFHPDILFLNGVGEIFPYIRTHCVLNNIQRLVNSLPTIIFFPGEYVQSRERGSSLKLFGKLQDDKYYRAYDITNYEA